VIVGQRARCRLGMNVGPADQLGAGLPVRHSGVNVNLSALRNAGSIIAIAATDGVRAGAVRRSGSMSNAPYCSRARAATSWAMRSDRTACARRNGSMPSVMNHMGVTVDRLAESYKISREAQDRSRRAAANSNATPRL